MYSRGITLVFAHILISYTLCAEAARFNARGVLAGAKLRCCIVYEPPIAFLNDRNYANLGIDGIIANYLNQMQGFLNWTCSSVQRYSDGSTTGFNNFITMMERCSENGTIKDDPHCKCDIGIGGWFTNSKRFGRVDFLPPFVYDSYQVIFHISDSKVSGRSPFFITTFDSRGWLCIFGLVLLFATIRMFSAFGDHARYQPLEPTVTPIRRIAHFLYNHPFFYRLRISIQRIFSRMILMPEPEDFSRPNNTFLWILKTVVTICGLFLILAYEASMTASIVQETVTSEFQSGKDFQTCRIDPKDVCLPRGGSFDTYWTEVLAKERPCHKGRSPHLMTSYEEVFQGVENRTCRFGILLESTVHSTIHRKYCGTILSNGNPIYTGGLAMVLPKDSMHTEVMSLATLKITDAVTVPSLEEFYSTTGSCSAELATSLPFQKLQLFFIIAFCTGFLFLTVVVIKWTLNRIGPSTDDQDEYRSRDLNRRQEGLLPLHLNGRGDPGLPCLRVHMTILRDGRMREGPIYPEDGDGRQGPPFRRDGNALEGSVHPAYVERKDSDDSSVSTTTASS